MRQLGKRYTSLKAIFGNKIRLISTWTICCLNKIWTNIWKLAKSNLLIEWLKKLKVQRLWNAANLPSCNTVRLCHPLLRTIPKKWRHEDRSNGITNVTKKATVRVRRLEVKSNLLSFYGTQFKRFLPPLCRQQISFKWWYTLQQ